MVSATGTVPEGEEMNIVFLATDRFKLYLGMEPITPDQNSEVEVRMDLVTPEEMVMMIRNLN